MFIAERMQALGPLAMEKRKLDNLHNFFLDVIVATTAHISLARASHVTKPDFKGMGVFISVYPEEEREYLCTCLHDYYTRHFFFYTVASTTITLLK